MKQPRKPERGHRPTGWIIQWPYCVKCGLLYLKNEVTRKAIKGPCRGDEE